MIPLNRLSLTKMIELGKDGDIFLWYSKENDEPIGKVMFGFNGFSFNMFAHGDAKDLAEFISEVGYVPVSICTDDYFVKKA